MNLIIKFLMIIALLLISNNRSIETIDTQNKRDKKPNIIFILSDDHTTNAISAYGVFIRILHLPQTLIELQKKVQY